MVNFRLQLVNNQNVSQISELNIALNETIATSLELKIADIINPEKRSGSKSKTITLPGSAETIKFFEESMDVNVDHQTFNANKKIDAYYYKYEVKQYEGRLQLLEVKIAPISKEVSFEVNIVGDVLGLFTDINTKFLSDVDFTTHPFYPNYLHTLTYANIVASWGNVGSGVYYGFINWGLNNGNFNFVKPQQLRAQLFAYDYLRRIFYDAGGYTWTSTFLESTFFKRLVVPPTGTVELSSTVLNNNKFLAQADGSQPAVSHTFTPLPFPLLYLAQTANADAQFQTEVYDLGNIFTTPNFSPNLTNKYNVTANIGVNIVFKKNGIAQTGSNFIGLSGNLIVLISGNVSGMANINASQLDFSPSNSNNFSIPLSNVNVSAFSNTKVQFRWDTVNFQTLAAGSGADTWTVETKIVSGSSFAAELANKDIYEGISVQPQDLIPENIKQSDFVNMLIRRFNLMIMPDPNNKKNYIIEPWTDFFDYNNPIDWTAKKDRSKPTTVVPMGELDFIKAKFQDKPDGDYLNTTYQEAWSETYGYHQRDVDNDFVKGEKVFETIISPTPYASIPTLPSMVIPHILKKENNISTQVKSNIRLLYASGLISLPTSQWTFSYNNGSSSVVYTQFPHVGHTDNPYNPTVDLNWGFPKEVYYTFPNQMWTTNNMFNKHYSKQFNQITDKDSSIVRHFFALNENDINTLDFRKVIFVDDAYYIINKIPNLDPQSEETVEVEMVKLVAYDNFSPTSVEFNNGLNNPTYTNLMVGGGNITGGESNNNLGDFSSIVGGSNNFIAGGNNG